MKPRNLCQVTVSTLYQLFSISYFTSPLLFLSFIWLFLPILCVSYIVLSFMWCGFFWGFLSFLVFVTGFGACCAVFLLPSWVVICLAICDCLVLFFVRFSQVIVSSLIVLEQTEEKMIYLLCFKVRRRRSILGLRENLDCQYVLFSWLVISACTKSKLFKLMVSLLRRIYQVLMAFLIIIFQTFQKGLETN